MPSAREVRLLLPDYIPSYYFHGGQLSFSELGRQTPGKSYVGRYDILIEVHYATIDKEAGFSGKVIAIGGNVDTFAVGDLIFGMTTSVLQAYLICRTEDIALRPAALAPTEAARIAAGLVYQDALTRIRQGEKVLILGDMTGFACQISRNKGCSVTSTENFDLGERKIINDDDVLKALTAKPYMYDWVVDATRDLDLYPYSNEFMTRKGIYISICPSSAFDVAKSKYLPVFLGGGRRTLRIVRPPLGPLKSKALGILADKVICGELRVLGMSVVPYHQVMAVIPSQRYVTVVDVKGSNAGPTIVHSPRSTPNFMTPNLMNSPRTPSGQRTPELLQQPMSLSERTPEIGGPIPIGLGPAPTSGTRAKGKSPAHQRSLSAQVKTPSRLSHSFSANEHRGEGSSSKKGFLSFGKLRSNSMSRRVPDAYGSPNGHEAVFQESPEIITSAFAPRSEEKDDQNIALMHARQEIAALQRQVEELRTSRNHTPVHEEENQHDTKDDPEYHYSNDRDFGRRHDQDEGDSQGRESRESDGLVGLGILERDAESDDEAGLLHH